MRLKDFVWYWLPVLAYMSLIFYLSSLPSVSVPTIGVSFSDKLYHVAEYFGLSVLLFRASRKSGFAYAFSIIFASFYGITDEFHQLFVPGRMFSVYDMIANAIGASLILLFRLRIFYKRKAAASKGISRLHSL